MSAFLFPRRGFLGVLAAAFWAAPWLAAQAQPLTFERAQALAEQSAPENLARQAQVASAQQAVGPADALPDPKLILGIDNLPIEGPDRYTLNRDSMTMRRIGLMQEVPNGDKRLARRQLAEASMTRAEAEQRAATAAESTRPLQHTVRWLRLLDVVAQGATAPPLGPVAGRITGPVLAQELEALVQTVLDQCRTLAPYSDDARWVRARQVTARALALSTLARDVFGKPAKQLRRCLEPVVDALSGTIRPDPASLTRDLHNLSTAEVFEAGRAYDLLRDPDKRSRYDRQQREAERGDGHRVRVEDGDHDDRQQVVDHGEGEQKRTQCTGQAASEHRQHGEREGDIGGGGDRPAGHGGRVVAVDEPVDQRWHQHAA